MKPLTICFCTARKEPKIEWFFQSLSRQLGEEEIPNIIVVDTYRNERDKSWLTDRFFPVFLTDHPKKKAPEIIWVEPMPSIWKGKSRITSEDWWDKGSDLNTSIILCKTEWWAWTDDRSVLAPGWLDRIKAAQEGMYAVCGSYEKYANLEVENGNESWCGELLGADTRTPGCYPFDSFYGGSGALPLEWCLMVNGWSSEICGGAGCEDSMFGVTLRNNNLPIKYDSAMKIIEDRTPGQIDGALKRADKNPHLGQQAKSWAIVRMFKDKLTSQNSYDIRNLRDRVLLNGESLDSFLPTASHTDWYDGAEIKDMV